MPSTDDAEVRHLLDRALIRDAVVAAPGGRAPCVLNNHTAQVDGDTATAETYAYVGEPWHEGATRFVDRLERAVDATGVSSTARSPTTGCADLADRTTSPTDDICHGQVVTPGTTEERGTVRRCSHDRHRPREGLGHPPAELRAPAAHARADGARRGRHRAPRGRAPDPQHGHLVTATRSATTMTAVPRREPPSRSVPEALMVYLGLPAFLIVAVVTTRDLLRTESDAVDTIVIVAVTVFIALFAWLALVQQTRYSDPFLFVAILVLGIIAIGIALLGSTTAVYLAVLAAMAGDTLAPRYALPIIAVAGLTGIGVGIAHDFEAAEIVTNGVVITTVGLFPLALRRLGETNDALVDARGEVAAPRGGRRAAALRPRPARPARPLAHRDPRQERARQPPGDDRRGAGHAGDGRGRGRRARRSPRCARRSRVPATHAGGRARRRAHRARARRRSTRCSLDVGGHALPTDIDETLGWVLREAVTNVVRHSGGTAATSRPPRRRHGERHPRGRRRRRGAGGGPGHGLWARRSGWS